MGGESERVRKGKREQARERAREERKRDKKMKKSRSSVARVLAYPKRLTMWNSGGMCFLASERGTSWSWYRALWGVFWWWWRRDKAVEVER